MSINTSQGLPATRPPSTTTGTKRLHLVDQEPRPEAEGVQRTHNADKNLKKRRRVTPEEGRDEEQAPGKTLLCLWARRKLKAVKK
jgi:hypothetical protein